MAGTDRVKRKKKSKGKGKRQRRTQRVDAALFLSLWARAYNSDPVINT